VRQLGEAGGVSLSLGRTSTHAASAPGIAQLAGPVLKNGDHLTLAGKVRQRSVLAVRVVDRSRKQTAVATFSGKDVLPSTRVRGKRARLRVGLRHDRHGRLSVRINGRKARSVKVDPKPGKRAPRKHRRHRKHP
jgi:hypothetical protein